MFFWLLACAQAPVSPEARVSPTPDAGEVGEVDMGPAEAGVYVSARCGQRTYAIHLSLTAHGSYRMEERISPCPEGTPCYWSGIVIHEGTFSDDGGEITLSEPERASANGPDLGREPVRTFTKTAGGLLSKRGCLFEKTAEHVR